MKVAIIDLDSIAYAIGNGNKVLDEQGNPIKVDNKFVYTDKTEQELKAWADYYLNQIMTKGGFTHYIGFIKGSGTTLRRLAVNPGYKGHRGKVAPYWWQPVKDYLIGHWKAIEASGHEVDDYVNVTRLNQKSSHIVSIDGDLLGLEGEHYNWRKQEWVTVTKWQAELKFWTDMIAGQVVDNVKGLPGKGPAFAKQVFDEPLAPLRNITFQTYVNALGELKGIQEFYRNYVCLKLLEEIEGFEVPQPIEYSPVDLLG